MSTLHYTRYVVAFQRFQACGSYICGLVFALVERANRTTDRGNSRRDEAPDRHKNIDNYMGTYAHCTPKTYIGAIHRLTVFFTELPAGRPRSSAFVQAQSA